MKQLHEETSIEYESRLRYHVQKLLVTLKMMTGHAELFNRDSDAVWMAIKREAEIAIRDAEEQ